MNKKFKTMKTTLRRVFCAMAIFSLFIGMFEMPEVHAANNTYTGGYVYTAVGGDSLRWGKR